MGFWEAILIAGAATSSPVEEGRGILFHVIEQPQVRAQRITLAGNLCANQSERCVRPVQLEAAKSDTALTVTVVAEGKALMKRSVPLSLMPDPDLNSAEFFGRDEPGMTVLVTFRFGQSNDCYANDEGRGRLAIGFGEGEADYVSITSFENCEVNAREVSSSELGSR